MDQTEYSAECFKMTIQSALYAGFLALGKVQFCMLYLKKGTEYSSVYSSGNSSGNSSGELPVLPAYVSDKR